MNILIIDGYNAIYAIAPAREKLRVGLKQARDYILSLCGEFVRSSGFIDDFRVVFDGDDRYRDIEKLIGRLSEKTVFSRKGEGDNKIIHMIRECSGKNKVIVASNDNYVRNNARAYGAKLIDPRDMLKVAKGDHISCDGCEKTFDRNLMARITKEYIKELNDHNNGKEG
ncbi:MAG: NYN domain-containing protein [Candidatus Omnitrophica bacterium]|nr:NYN domain-containing protein [Candidatus Omnitrophota bacterium]